MNYQVTILYQLLDDKKEPIDLSEAVYNVAANTRVEAIVSAKETFTLEPYNFNKKVIGVNAKEVISNE